MNNYVFYAANVLCEVFSSLITCQCHWSV